MAKFELLLCSVLLAVFASLPGLNGAAREPGVKVYTRYPVEPGKENIFQCYVEGFHPPKITIELLKNNQPMPSQKTDLSFDKSWAFHQLVYANVTMDKYTEYACKVEHETLSGPKIVRFDPEF